MLTESVYEVCGKTYHKIADQYGPEPLTREQILRNSKFSPVS
jgi:hypothetical protein